MKQDLATKLSDWYRMQSVDGSKPTMARLLKYLEEECDKVELPEELIREMRSHFALHVLVDIIHRLRRDYFFVPKSQSKEAA